MAASTRYDFIIFGASGFTGQYVVEEAAKTEKDEGGFSWAIAGRNIGKLQAVLKEAGKHADRDLDEIPIVMADVAVENSILEMCKQTKVLLNCVGPYQLYGHSVVKACLEAGTHHIDISGEPAFLEKVQLLHHSTAQTAGVYVLQSCGFDSVPADMGTVFIQRAFGEDHDVNDVESYLLIKNGPQGGHGNYGTWQSAVHSFEHASERTNTRRQLCSKRLPKSPHKMIQRRPVFFSNDVNSWVLPFFGADRSIVSRTQYYNYEVKNERPVQFNAFMRVDGFMSVCYLCLMGLVFGIFSKFSLGRYLMLKFPRLMSLGLFSSQGPTREQIKGASFNMTFIGRGHGSHLEDPTEQHNDKPDQTIVAKVTGPEIGYDTTPICMMQAAYVLLKEQDKLPKGGGVFTPGMAFANTSMLERLAKRNVVFRTIEKKGF